MLATMRLLAFAGWREFLITPMEVIMHSGACKEASQDALMHSGDGDGFIPLAIAEFSQQP
jgi:hypothetical protein